MGEPGWAMEGLRRGWPGHCIDVSSMWRRTLAGLVTQMTLQGMVVLTHPLEGQKKKIEVPKGEGILPPSVTQDPYLSFLTFWVLKCMGQLKETSRWMQGACPGPHGHPEHTPPSLT